MYKLLLFSLNFEVDFYGGAQLILWLINLRSPHLLYDIRSTHVCKLCHLPTNTRTCNSYGARRATVSLAITTRSTEPVCAEWVTVSVVARTWTQVCGNRQFVRRSLSLPRPLRRTELRRGTLPTTETAHRLPASFSVLGVIRFVTKSHSPILIVLPYAVN